MTEQITEQNPPVIEQTIEQNPPVIEQTLEQKYAKAQKPPPPIPVANWDNPESPYAPKRLPGQPPRAKGRRHPFLDGWPTQHWCEAAVGKVHNYPKTLEKFLETQLRSRIRYAAQVAAGKKMSRLGVPDGMGRRGTKGVAHFKALAKHEAERIFNYMKQEDMLVEPDNEIANAALRGVIEITRNLTVSETLRHAAFRTLLEWTRSKPASKLEATVVRAEDFLTDLAHEALSSTRPAIR